MTKQQIEHKALEAACGSYLSGWDIPVEEVVRRLRLAGRKRVNDDAITLWQPIRDMWGGELASAIETLQRTLIQFHESVSKEEAKNPGCNCCGTNDRMAGHQVCPSCLAEKD